MHRFFGGLGWLFCKAGGRQPAEPQEVAVSGPTEPKPQLQTKGLCPRCDQRLLVGQQLEMEGGHLAHGTQSCGTDLFAFWNHG